MYAKDIDGKWHSIVDQAKGSSCGPTCVRMVVNMALNQQIGEEFARQLVEIDEGAETVSTLASEEGAARAGSHDWGRHGHHGSGHGGSGSYAANLANVLQGLGLKSARLDRGGVKTALAQTSRKRPGIARVEWTPAGHGAHFVVVAGTVSNGKALVLDPVYGLQYADLSSASVEYLPSLGPHGDAHAHATFTQWTVLTNE